MDFKNFSNKIMEISTPLTQKKLIKVGNFYITACWKEFWGVIGKKS